MKNGRPFHVHIIDKDGYIIRSTLTPDQNITKKEVIGTYVGEHINEEDVLCFLDKIKLCLESTGVEICTYSVQGSSFLCRMQKVSNNRIKMHDYKIDGLSTMEIIDMMNKI